MQKCIGADFTTLRDLALPFPGRWHTHAITRMELAEFVAQYFHSYDPAERLRYLELAASYDPSSLRGTNLRQSVLQGHLAWGRKYTREGNEAAATSHFEKALQLAPDNVSAHNDFGALLANFGKLDAAEKHFRRALELDPENVLAKRNLALLEQLRNR